MKKGSRSERQSKNPIADEQPKKINESNDGGKQEQKKRKKSKDNAGVDKDENDKGSFVLVTLFNLLLYLLYITIVCIITFGARTSGSYHLSKVIYDLFIDTEFDGYGGATSTFRTSSTINDFWAFTDNVMLRGLYREDWYWFHDPFINENIQSPNKLAFMFDNHLIGRARLRQLRMVQDTCPVTTLVPLLSRTCYPEYQKSKEDTQPFDRILGEEDGWNYKTEGGLDSTSVVGSLSTYSGAGSVILLETTSQDTREQLLLYRNNLWITRASRAIFLDFTFFNPSINLFCTVSLVWEIPATGGVTTSWNIQTIQHVRYTTSYQQGILVCQIAFICLTIFYVMQDFISMFRRGFAEHFGDIWTYVTIAILIISVFAVLYNFLRYFELNKAVENIVIGDEKFVNFQHLGYYESIYNDCVAIGLFLVWIKLFKYLSFNASLLQLSGTLARCAQDIGGFGLIFLIIFLGFAQLGYALFGKQVYGFSTFGRSIFTLLQFILGEFNYREIKDANRVLGPAFYLAYILFVFMILVNMFLAIINDSYHAVRQEIELKGNKFETRDCIAALCCCRDNNENQKIKVAETVDDIHIDPSVIRNYLQGKQFSDVEVEMFFARFDVDEDDTLNADEGHKLLSDLTTNNYRTKKSNPQTQKINRIMTKHTESSHIDTKHAKEMARAEADEIVSRLGAIESVVVELYPKLDSVLGRAAEYYDKKQKLRREAKEPLEYF